MESPRHQIECGRLSHRLCPAMSALMILIGSPGLAQSQDLPRAHNMVVNGEARTHMPGPKGNEILRGRVSGHLSFTEESVEKGVVLVEGLNFVTFGVDQESITGIKPTDEATSALGSTVSTREPQVL